MSPTGRLAGLRRRIRSLHRWLGEFRARLPAGAETDTALRDALRRRGLDHDRYLRTADALSLAVAVGVTGIAVALGAAPALAATLAAASGASAATVARRVPRLLERVRRSRAVGGAPALVNRAAVRMRVEPTAEGAAAFAAREGEGPLADRLGEHVRRSRGTARAGLEGFATEWADEAPELGRACSLLRAAAAAPAAERSSVLDRALDAVVDGARERADAAAAALRGPVTAVYAFGVLLPLALVAALPAARVAGLPVTGAGVVVVYDLLLPAGLCVAAAWLVARRPVAAPVVTVPRSHPDVPSDPRSALAAAAVAAVAGWVTAGQVAPWARPLGAVAAGGGAAGIAWYRSQRAVRERVRNLEAGLPDALHAVGRRVRRGEAVEAAIAAAADDVEGPAGEALAGAARRQRVLGVGVAEAFLGDDGALARTPSARARSVARLVALAAAAGRPAGAALESMAAHFADLDDVERDVRRAVGDATATMGNTAAVFAPLVGGVTVALADRVAGSSFGGAPAVPTPLLGAAVGWYVLLLAAILSALGAGLDRGFDRALVGYRVSLALPSAAAVYLAAFVAGRLVA